MDYKQPHKNVRTGPEATGAMRLKRFMIAKGWSLKKLHGGKYQEGLPDYVCMHSLHGLKWIEMKAPGGKLRQSQIKCFGEFEKYGQQVYVLEDEQDYPKLFKTTGNWRAYIRC